MRLSIKGFIILELNYHTKAGEIDIIAIEYSKMLIKNNDNYFKYVKTLFINYSKYLGVLINKIHSNKLHHIKINNPFNDVKTTRSRNLNFAQINKLKLIFIKFQKLYYKQFLQDYKKYNQHCSLVFIEVKSKTTSKYGLPENMVTKYKVKHIHNLSYFYTAYQEIPKRFDTACVLLNPKFLNNPLLLFNLFLKPNITTKDKSIYLRYYRNICL